MLSFTLLALLVPVTLAAPASKKPDLSCESTSKRLIVFGDSLSDNGTGTWVRSNGILPVSPPYYQHSWSNGPGWAEMLATQKKLEVHNYAQGGATIDNDVVPGLIHPEPLVISNSVKEQVAAYLAKDKPRKNDVYVIHAGANEAFGFPDVNITGTQAVAMLHEQIGELYKQGAKKVLLATLPDLTVMPYIKLQTSTFQDYTAKYSADYRTATLKLAKQWSKLIDIEVIDIYKAVNRLLEKPSRNGFNASAVAEPCYPGSYHVFDAPVCDQPDTYFFWDHVHPSAATWRLLMKDIVDAYEKL